MECCLDVLPNSHNKYLENCVALGKENEHLTGSKERTHSMVKLMISSASFVIFGTKMFLMVLSLKWEIASSISCLHPPENDRKFTFLLILGLEVTLKRNRYQFVLSSQQ